MGIPCAALCISIKLYRIASMRFKPRTMIERRNGALIDLAWMIFTPVAYALLTLINQGHRFNVVEGQGCQPAIYFTPVAAFVDYGLPLGISFISILCSLMALGYFIVQKKNFEHVVSQSRCGLNTKRFIRMTSFTIIDLMLTFPTLLANFGLELAIPQCLPTNHGILYIRGSTTYGNIRQTSLKHHKEKGTLFCHYFRHGHFVPRGSCST